MSSPAPSASTPGGSTGLGLALPRSQPKSKKSQQSSAPAPVFGAVPQTQQQKERKRKRKQSAMGGNMDRALDEGDDVDESDLVLVRRGGRFGRAGAGADEDGDEDNEGENEGEDGIAVTNRRIRGRGAAAREIDEGYDDVDGEGEGEGDEEEGEGDEEIEDREGGRRGMVVGAGGKRSVEVETDEDVKKRDKKAKGERLALRSLLDTDQAKRFDAFSVAVIPKQVVKKLNKEIYDQRINDKLGLMLAGMAKIFVADMVELAKDLQPHTQHPTGPLKSYHLRMARGIMEERGILPGHNTAGGGGKKPLFRR